MQEIGVGAAVEKLLLTKLRGGGGVALLVVSGST
jgi:hypothetical protein